MRSWKKARLGDFAEVLLGKMLDKAKNKGELHPYLSNKDVRWGSFDTHDLSLMRFEEHEHERFGLKYGDLVVCEGGVPGRCAIWKDQVPDMKIQKALHRVRVKAGYSNEFVYYRFLLAGRTGQLEKYLIGSTIKHLTGVNLKQVEFEYPDLDTQQRIASVLSALDDKIALNTRINAELEAMAKLLYDYWFVQFDFPNAKGKPYKSTGGAMVHNAELKREVPEGWEVVNLLEEMDVQYGFPFDTNQFTEDTKAKPVVRIRDILGCSFSAYSTQEVHEKYALQSGDLLIGMDGNFHMNYWDRDAGYLNQRSVRIRSRKGSSVSNVQCFYDIQPHIKAREASVSRTTVGHLSDKDLKRMYVLVPEESKFFRPKQTFDGLLAMMLSNRVQNQELTTLRDWLLPLLMNGQVVVGEAEEKVGLAMAAEGQEPYGSRAAKKRPDSAR